MAGQWALLIGINQYAELQPLMYAQADAIELRNFLVDELGLVRERCVLLTDMSAVIEPYAQVPVRREIESHLQALCQNLQADDILWVFFSGYGLTEAGQDYLVPVDGDPNQLSESAIAMSWLFSTLKQAPTDQILVALDMNRSQGATAPGGVGQQTQELAKASGIPLLLSCQPDQYAHETMAVRHGLFTQALLEGLRYHGCVTVSQLAAYLSDRVPELSEHHWRPQQNPVMVVPPAQKFMMVVPQAALASLPLTETAATQVASPDPADGRAESVASPPAAAADPGDPSTAIVPSPEEINNNAALWNWGILGVAVALLLGVVIRYQPFWRDIPETATNSPPAADQARADGASAANGAAAADTAAPSPESAEQSALQRAAVALEAGRYGEARAWLDQVPPEQQTKTYAELRQRANSAVAQAAEQNQAILQASRRLLQPVSASLFNDAIENARKIPPEDPYYEQAQQDIDRWSQVILDIAEGRAETGDVSGAIAAAQLVPEDRPEVYRQAQQRIARWQQQLNNQQLIQQAQNQLQPGQASSFQEAIRLLQQITPDQPGYATAQDRINQWSQDILVIARARAAQGRWADAIAAARLVPPNTSAYEQAQAEIQRWQAQP